MGNQETFTFDYAPVKRSGLALNVSEMTRIATMQLRLTQVGRYFSGNGD